MKSVLFGLICLLLTSCQTKIPVVTPEVEAQMRQDLVSGKAVLDCNISCSGSFFAAKPQLKKLYVLQDWPALGTSVMRIGFQYDLGYFYLGRAAEGVGAYEAAQKYYRMAGYLATEPSEPGKCAGIRGQIRIVGPEVMCDGFSFPRDLYPRLAFVQNAIARSQMTTRAPIPYTPTPVAAPAATQVSAPVRPAAPIRRPSPSLKPTDAVAEEAEWVRPPPTIR